VNDDDWVIPVYGETLWESNKQCRQKWIEKKIDKKNSGNKKQKACNWSTVSYAFWVKKLEALVS